jgi:molybdenum cofactor cytidylyltransferase/nicotine blue oxidoreductase
MSRPTFDSPSLRLAVLLLAAGQGSRLGSFPKALLKKSDQSLLKKFCLTAQFLDPIQFLIVTGFHAQVIEDHLEELQSELNIPIRVLCNPHPEKGQASSIRLGLESLTWEYDVLLVALSDQPEIGNTEIQALLEAFQDKEVGQEIVLPMINGQRGNPVLFSKKSIEAILRVPDMVCRQYMDAHPEQVKQLITDNTAYLVDVDTEQDIQRLGLNK